MRSVSSRVGTAISSPVGAEPAWFRVGACGSIAELPQVRNNVIVVERGAVARIDGSRGPCVKHD